MIGNLKNYFNNYTLHTLHYSNVKQKTSEEVIKYSTKLYQEMFDMMCNNLHNEDSGLIFDRTHLGEMVYGNIYRGYIGDYVLEIEKSVKHILDIKNNLFLITLIDEAQNLIAREDGLSFSTDLDKKQREIELFQTAHESSNIKNKLIINIKDKDAETVFLEVISYINSHY